MKKVLICCSGKTGAGKSEFAKIAVEEFGFVDIPFAKALKEEVWEFLVCNAIPFESKNIYGSQEEKEMVIPIEHPDWSNDDIWKQFVSFSRDNALTYRSLLQFWGTQLRRDQYGESYWIDRAFSQAKKHDRVVISDLRFVNEYKAIRSIGGYTVRINRDNSFQSATANHISEIALDHIRNWTYKINNNGTLEEFHSNCRYILDEMCKE